MATTGRVISFAAYSELLKLRGARDWLARLLGAEEAGVQLEAAERRPPQAGFRDILEARRPRVED